MWIAPYDYMVCAERYCRFNHPKEGMRTCLAWMSIVGETHLNHHPHSDSDSAILYFQDYLGSQDVQRSRKGKRVDRQPWRFPGFVEAEKSVFTRSLSSASRRNMKKTPLFGLKKIRNFLRCLFIRFSALFTMWRRDPCQFPWLKWQVSCRSSCSLGISVEIKPIWLFQKAATTTPRPVGPSELSNVKLPSTGVLEIVRSWQFSQCCLSPTIKRARSTLSVPHSKSRSCDHFNYWRWLTRHGSLLYYCSGIGQCSSSAVWFIFQFIAYFDSDWYPFSIGLKEPAYTPLPLQRESYTSDQPLITPSWLMLHTLPNWATQMTLVKSPPAMRKRLDTPCRAI